MGASPLDVEWRSRFEINFLLQRRYDRYGRAQAKKESSFRTA